MELCSKGHIKICHQSWFCPVCDALKGKQDAEAEVAGLKAKVAELEAAIDRLDDKDQTDYGDY